MGPGVAIKNGFSSIIISASSIDHILPLLAQASEYIGLKVYRKLSES